MAAPHRPEPSPPVDAHAPSGVPLDRVWRSERPISLALALGTLRRGPRDPCTVVEGPNHWVRAMHTPRGAATLSLTARVGSGDVLAQAWGEGSAWVLERVPAMLGDEDDDSAFVAHHEPVRQARRRFPHWRVPRSGLVLESLIPAIIEQKVTGQEAFLGQRTLVRRFGSPAPGPAHWRLMLPPTPAQWAAIPSWEFLQARVDGARSRTVVEVARRAGRLEALTDRSPHEARDLLTTVPGVGRWTAAEVGQRALGDADAVSFGDYHVAKNIGWALLGHEIDDDALAELLEPYAGHRFRVQRLLELAGMSRPRHGARMSPRTHLPG